ncbi:1-acyl-sn-glycerol-3-phosphate acyltransferase isoform X2 [Jatropha curcas]|uniref:1-acyl-sn-glycerol-3-phosphate acyltransferase isoform X2 n=1 Tax=Jatropha curcas TaxID=180498 RepID=UPI0005FBE83D|nr:1-acyl-sn-glycerol-3-phosphate acyltransferase isoform X2 [Jatropha curcas]
MENTGSGSFMRNRRLESFLTTNSIPNVKKNPKESVREEVEQRHKSDVYVDDDGWVPALISCVRIVVCFVSMMVTTFIWALVMLLLLPWPYERIRQGNIYGHVTGRMMIIWYPLFGQLYVLANHLRIDRSNPTAAIQSMKEAACAVVKNNLSLIIFPEGTRSKNGRLLPFKKGFVHLALQTRLPIVPMVFTGTHLAWRKGSLHVRPAPITVKYLHPIKTDHWSADTIDDHVKMVYNTYVENLPEPQRPAC